MIPIYKNIITTVIAPHGITDMIHAVQYNITSEIMALYGSVLGASVIMANNAPIILDVSFIVASVVHFRHDMPVIKYVPKCALSTLLIGGSVLYDPNILFLYMVAIHVPNHYRINWRYIRENTKKNIGVIFLCTVTLYLCGEIFPIIYESQLAFDCSKGLVISHIIYDEKHIYPDEIIET
jgi:hypothetical protein